MELKGGSFLNEHYPFENTPLPYAGSALEPYIDEQTMILHHDRHLQTYIDNLNAVLKEHPRLQSLSLEQLITRADRLPKKTGIPLSRNAGGVYNHRFYFDGLTPETDQHPNGALAEAIDRSFGGYDAFREKFAEAAKAVFGSGYAWLVKDPYGSLKISTTANQETPLPAGLCPILNIDVWEHAYYLKHFNRRADYIDNWWHVVNWRKAEARYLACKK
jgi:Fe-Mn family superoxide dismutase